MKNKIAIGKRIGIISVAVLLCFSLFLTGCSESSNITVDNLTKK